MNGMKRKGGEKPGAGKKIRLFFIILLIFAIGLFTGFSISTYGLKNSLVDLKNSIGSTDNQNTAHGIPTDVFQDEIFIQAYEFIKSEYVEQEVDDQKLYYGALQGMVAALGDPYSVFFEPVTSEKFQQEISGSFDGIGAEIGIRNGLVTVISPLPGSPAEQAGLRGGDVVLGIDDTDTKDMNLSEAVNMIRGKKGTEVKLRIARADEQVRDITIIRAEIPIYSIDWEILDNNIVHLKLKYFNEDTLDDFKKAMSEFLPKNPRGIILDVRNNPGGLLISAMEITSYWVGGDDVIVIEKKRDDSFIGLKANNKNALLKGIPTVVLINQGSASGSEILAGALQDYKVVKLIGEKSFGKGSVQDLRNFDDGSSIKLTIAKWLTPLGREINATGIEPDIQVELTEEDWSKDIDPQLDSAIAEIMKTAQ